MTKLPPKPNELFTAERPVRSDFARQGGIPYAARRTITLFVLFALLGGAGYWAWKSRPPAAPEEIPTIKAEGPAKQRPEQPGGVDIPNQDVQVYHEIDGGAVPSSTKPVVEHMLPPPEEPNAKMAGDLKSFAQPATSADQRVEELRPAGGTAGDAAKSDPILDVPQQPIATTVSPVAPKPEAQPVAVVTPAPSPAAVEPAPNPAPAVEPVPVKAPVVAPVVATKPVATATKNQMVVQLAALPDEKAAAALSQKLQTKYQSILGAGHLHPVRADLGAKGVFYRIQSQPMNEAQAKTICAALKNQNAGCLLVVVRP